MSFIYDLVDTWNAGGTTFTAIKMNVTDSASSASSLLMDLQVGGTSRFKVDKSGDVIINGGTVTTSSPVFDAAQTWNASGTTFTGLRLNVTDTASASASLLMDLQVGGTSQFRVAKNGRVYTSLIGSDTSLTAAWFFSSANAIAYINGGEAGRFTAAGLVMPPSFGINWNSDLFFTRRNAANLRLGAPDAAGSAISISSVASNQLTLASNHGLSNGAAVQITFTAGGAVPTGTAVNTTYYARSISAAVLELYGTYDQALNTASTTGRLPVTTAGTTAFVNRATPFQTLSVQSFTGTDIPGQPFVITGSQGTGTGRGGDIIFQVAPAGSSGTAQNALVAALTIDSTRLATFAGNITVSGGTAIILPSAMRLTGFSGSAYLDSGDSLFHFRNYTTFAEAVLAVDAANTLALRNGANAQTFRVYNTTDGTNGDFFKIEWASNSCIISTDKLGAGSNRSLLIRSSGQINLTPDTTLYFGGGSNPQWQVGSNGHLVAYTDNAHDIGASGATRPRNVYVGTSVFTGAGGINFDVNSRIRSPADGQITLFNAALNDFGRLNFGGTNSSFPALKRSSATLQVRLADDSAYAKIEALNLTNGRTIQKFTPLDNQPPATNFATLDTRNSVATLDFDDGATNEEAVFVGVIPEGAILTSGIKVRIFWAATSATSGACRWGAQFEKYGTDIDSDSFDTATEGHSTTSGTSGIVNVTELTCTTIDSVVAGDQFRIKIYRDSSDTTNDTMTGDAELIAVELQQVA